MTLIVGLRCADGFVLAADSAASDSHAPIRTTTNDKLWQLEPHPIVCGASGSVGVIQDVKDATSRFKMKASRDAVRRNLVGLIRPVLANAMQGHVPVGGHMCPNADFLIGGITGDEPFLLEVTKQAETTWFHNQEGNFYAIGSGAVLAHALFRRFWRTEPYDRMHGELLVYRVVRDAIDLASQGLSGPVRILVAESNGSIRKLSKSDIHRLEVNCDVWREMEWETLGVLAGSALREPGNAMTSIDAPAPPTVQDA